MKTRVIHIREAVRRILDHRPHEISVWEQDTGVILNYHKAVYIGGSPRAGSIRVRLGESGEIRQFCEIMLRKVDDLRVQL